MAIEKDIFSKLKDLLSTLSWVNTVEYENIRMYPGDFQDHEIPCIQFFDGGQALEHAHSRMKVAWAIHIELVLKQTAAGTVNKGDLLDKRQEIEQLIGSNVDLGISGMIHFRYTSNITDLHSIAPYYYTRMDFEALYYKPYVT
jgi:hypothetical protein